MRNFFSDALHIFIIFMMAAFIIGGILAVTGTFDHWGSRYILKRRRRRLLRNRIQAKRDPGQEQVKNATPYYSTKNEKPKDDYKGRYA